MDGDELARALESLRLAGAGVERGRYGESYLVDNLSGIKTIMPTKRPDGTFRKEIKIRPGYVPPEERQVYIPVHKRTVNISLFRKPEPDLVPKDIRFLKFPENELQDSRPRNLTQLLRKNPTRHVASGPKEPPTRQDFKSLFDLQSELKSKPEMYPKPDLRSFLNHVPELPHMPPNKGEQAQEIVSIDRKKIANGINNTLKKIREVKLLQEKLRNGVDLDPNQLKKVNRLPELEQKLKELKTLDRWELK